MLFFLDLIQSNYHHNLIQTVTQKQAIQIIPEPLFILRHVLFYVILIIFFIIRFFLNLLKLLLCILKIFLAFFLFFFPFFNIVENLNKFNELCMLMQRILKVYTILSMDLFLRLLFLIELTQTRIFHQEYHKKEYFINPNNMEIQGKEINCLKMSLKNLGLDATGRQEQSLYR